LNFLDVNGITDENDKFVSITQDLSSSILSSKIQPLKSKKTETSALNLKDYLKDKKKKTAKDAKESVDDGYNNISYVNDVDN